MAGIPHFPFDEAKATQVAALLIRRCGGFFDHYLLTKCLYDLDREALARWGQPVVGGTYRLYEHGPLIEEHYQSAKLGATSLYAERIHRAENQVSVSRDPGTDELSKAEIELAERVLMRWKNLNFSEARRRIHALPECDDPGLVGDLIPIEVILRNCGKSPAEVRAIAADLKAQAALMSALKL